MYGWLLLLQFSMYEFWPWSCSRWSKNSSMTSSIPDHKHLVWNLDVTPAIDKEERRMLGFDIRTREGEKVREKRYLFTQTCSKILIQPIYIYTQPLSPIKNIFWLNPIYKSTHRTISNSCLTCSHPLDLIPAQVLELAPLRPFKQGLKTPKIKNNPSRNQNPRIVLFPAQAGSTAMPPRMPAKLALCSIFELALSGTQANSTIQIRVDSTQIWVGSSAAETDLHSRTSPVLVLRLISGPNLPEPSSWLLSWPPKA